MSQSPPPCFAMETAGMAAELLSHLPLPASPLSLALTAVVALLLLRVLLVLHAVARPHRKRPPGDHLSTLIVLGSGAHRAALRCLSCWAQVLIVLGSGAYRAGLRCLSCLAQVLIVLGSGAHIRTPPCSPPPFSTTHASFPPPPHHLPPSRSFSNLTAASAARVSCSRAAPLLHTILAALHPVPFLSPHTQATPFRTPYKFHPPCFPHTHSCSPCCCAPPTSCTFLPPACFLRLRRYPPHTPLPFPVLPGGHTAEMLCVVGALDHTHTCSPSLLLPQLLPSAPRPCLSSAPSGGHTAEMMCLVSALDSGRYSPRCYICSHQPANSRLSSLPSPPSPSGPHSGDAVSWGHTAEMLCLVGALDHGRYSPRCYIAAATDAISLPKARQLEQALAQEAPAPALPVPPPSYLSVYRSREVGQSYLTSVLTTIAATLHAMLLVARVRPQLLLCNGPGTCLPICIAVFTLHVLGVQSSSIVFVESVARVDHLSLTGRLLHRLGIVDRFFVQWPHLTTSCKGTHYVGRLM
ncbi:unnamed protein product [Closterium sp. NIES-65]|nr:unnamed protein product [Closterium sp. NIES-65]